MDVLSLESANFRPYENPTALEEDSMLKFLAVIKSYLLSTSGRNPIPAFAQISSDENYTKCIRCGYWYDPEVRESHNCGGHVR